MAGFDPVQTNRGNWRCGYCSHASWKRRSAAVNHIREHHKAEAELSQVKADAAEKVRKAERAKADAEWRAEQAERKLREATKPKPVEQRYSAVVYCPTCLSVDSVRIVKGQAIGGGGCFRCGVVGGMLVEHVNVNAGSYSITN